MPATADLATLVMEDTMARGLLTPRPTMVESDTPATVDSAILVMEDTTARGLLILRPTTVDSAMLDMVGMAMVLDTDTLDKLQIHKVLQGTANTEIVNPQKSRSQSNWNKI